VGNVVHSNVTVVFPLLAIVVPFAGNVVHSKVIVVVPFAVVPVVVPFT
jgi:hypothetical protein